MCCSVGGKVEDGVEVLEQAQHSRWQKAQAQQLTWPALRWWEISSWNCFND